MKKCVLKVLADKKPCDNKECRLYLNYNEDLNCTLVAVDKYGDMTLEQIAKRHSLSIVRIKQIVDSTLEKIKKPFLHENTI